MGDATLVATDQTIRQRGSVRDIVGFMGDPPIFGAIHVPDQAHRGLIICSPVYAEFMQNYGREVRLARRLANAGVAVARFHYRGTGDSAGDAAAVTIDSMVADALEVVEHLRRASGVAGVDVLGTRLGGQVAAAVAAQLDDARLVIWEPIPNVKRYFDEVLRARRMVGVIAQDDATSGSVAMLAELEQTGRLDVVGYLVHKALFDSAHAHEMTLGDVDDVLLVQASRSDKVKAAIRQMADGVTDAGGGASIVIVPPGEGWWIHDYDEALPPDHGRDIEGRLLDATVTWLER